MTFESEKIKSFIDLTLDSSDSETTEFDDQSDSHETETGNNPFSPPLIISGNILSSRHYRILNSKSSWFTDDIINAYFCKLTGSSLNLFAFSSFFYDALIHKGQDYCLKHWLVKSFKEFLAKEPESNHKLVLFPVNSGGSHWVLVAWQVSAGELYYYDSLMCKKSGNLIMKHISKLINSFLEEEEFENSLKSLSIEDDVCKDKIIERTHPKIEKLLITKGQPQQTDGSSCGVFCCLFGEILSKQKKITNLDFDIYKFRESLIDFFLDKQ